MNDPELEGFSPALDESGDPLWRIAVYRLAIQVLDHATDDTSTLLKRGNARSLADQLFRAAGSVGANIAEGYSRSSGSDRVRMFEYALGSARECRVWYRAARHLLSEERVRSQHYSLGRICKLLLTMIPEERKRLIRKSGAPTRDELTQHATRSTQHDDDASATLHPGHAP